MQRAYYLAPVAGMSSHGIAGIAVGRDDIAAQGRDERLGIESYCLAEEGHHETVSCDAHLPRFSRERC